MTILGPDSFLRASIQESESKRRVDRFRRAGIKIPPVETLGPPALFPGEMLSIESSSRQRKEKARMLPKLWGSFGVLGDHNRTAGR